MGVARGKRGRWLQEVEDSSAIAGRDEQNSGEKQDEEGDDSGGTPHALRLWMRSRQRDLTRRVHGRVQRCWSQTAQGHRRRSALWVFPGR